MSLAVKRRMIRLLPGKSVSLHAIALPILACAVIGFGLVISMTPVRVDPTLLLQERAGHVTLVATEESR